MSIHLVIATLVASLTGSPHCAGMCGPFAAIATSSQDSCGDHSMVRTFWVTTIYNAGRLTTYLLFGILAGLIGMTLSSVGSLAGLQHFAILLAGGMMVIVGSIGAGRILGWVRLGGTTPRFLQPILKYGMKVARAQHGFRRAYLMGFVTTFLPCGWLYVFVLAAIATQSLIQAPIVMMVFWLGTLPMMSAIGVGSGVVLGRFKKQLKWLPPLLMISIGTYSILFREPIDPQEIDQPISSVNLEENISSLDPHRLPCCCDEQTSEQKPVTEQDQQLQTDRQCSEEQTYGGKTSAGQRANEVDTKQNPDEQSDPVQVGTLGSPRSISSR